MDVEKIAAALQRSQWERGAEVTSGKRLMPDAKTRAEEDARAAIRAVLEELREPSEAMLINVGTMEGFDTDRRDADRCHVAWFRAMIEQAMKEVE